MNNNLESAYIDADSFSVFEIYFPAVDEQRAF